VKAASVSDSRSKYRQYVDEAKGHVRKLLEKETVMYVTEMRVRLDVSVDQNVRYWHWVTYDAIQEMFRKRELKRRQRLGTYRVVSEGEEEGESKKGSRITFYFPSEYSYGDVRSKLTSKLELVNEFSSESNRIGRYAEDVLEKALVAGGFEVKDRASPTGPGIRTFGGKVWRGKHDFDFIVYGEREKRTYGIQLKNRLTYPEWDDVAGLVDICSFFGLSPWFVARQMPGEYVEDLLSCEGFYSLFYKWLIPDELRELGGRIASVLGFPVCCGEAECVRLLKGYVEVLHRY
jgi:hypothetical protein